jgi:Holliday junction resolvase RusA-like endonuclease
MSHNNNNGNGAAGATASNPIVIDGNEVIVPANLGAAVPAAVRRRISGTLPGRPIPQQQRGYTLGRKGGRGRFFDPNSQQKKIAAAVLRANRLEDDEDTGSPIRGPLSAMVTFWYRATDAAQCGKPYTQRPDLDNLLKFLFDVMDKADFFDDDSQVTFVTTSKRYCLEMGINNVSHTTYLVLESNE